MQRVICGAIFLFYYWSGCLKIIMKWLNPLLVESPFGFAYYLCHPKGILKVAKIIINQIRLYRTDLSPHQFFEYGKLLVGNFSGQVL